MSAGTCFTDLHAAGKIGNARFDEWRPRYEGLVAQYARLHALPEAEAMATRRVLELMESAALEKKRQALLQARAQGGWAMRMKARLEAEGMRGARVAGEQAMVDMDGQRRAIRDQALQMNAAFLGQQRKTMTGKLRRPAAAREVLDEIFGKDTGNPSARAMAEAWRQTGEWLRSRFNEAGGHIAKMDAWHLPQRHDMAMVKDAGFETWRDFLMQEGILDRARMIDMDTGAPFSDERLELILKDMFEAIASDGWTRNSPGQMFVGATANQRAAHRVLHFADADAWEAYAANYGGGGTALDAMIGHIEGMARDIAAMQAMGPNPTATLRWQQDWMDQQAALLPDTGRALMEARDEASAAGGQMGRLFDEYTGKAQVPERRRLALGFSMFRSVQVAAKLGGAVLSVGGDYGLMIHNARFNGIPAHRVMGRYLSMLKPGSTADRAQAARHVLMIDQWADGHAGMWRTTGEEIGSEGARLLASGTLRASGLIHHTDVARQSFAMEMVAHVTHMRERGFANLDPSFQRLLQRYNITEARWDSLRQVQPESWKDTDWLYPQTVAAAGDQRLADDFMRMLVTEADFAVPVPDLRTRTVISSLAPKGRWGGEILRSTFLFKGFPLAILNMHGRRMLAEGASGLQVGGFMAAQLAARYGLTLLALTTLGGALSIQVKEIARGRDPRDMTTLKFWGQAALQGGGLGIVGDLLAAGENQFGGGVAQTAAGPGAQTLDTALELAKTPVRLLDDEEANDDHWKRAVAKAVMSETPGASLWYGRLLLDRTMGDLLNEWAYGDDWEQRQRRMAGYAEDLGTAYWAPPGEGVQRAPDLGNALGGAGGGADGALEVPELPN